MAIQKEALDDCLNGDAAVLYEELVRVRNRLADLPPPTSLDFEQVARAMHEVVFYLITPPPGPRSSLGLSADTFGNLVTAARDRNIDLYVTLVAMLTRKLALRRSDRDHSAAQVDALRDTLDALTFDARRPKRETLAALRSVRADLDARIRYVTAARISGYPFQELPELYAKRRNRKERPDQFLGRVYGPHIQRGLTQADIRKVDPAYYNVLHVWCSRHQRKLSALVPATRFRRD